MNLDNGKISVILIENKITGNKSYSIKGIKGVHYNIGVQKVEDMIKFFGEEKFLNLLEEKQNFQKVQEIYDSEITENNSLDDFINFNNDFGGVLTKEMIEMIDFLEPFKGNYYIAGGTAISLHLKHRESVDFDTFSNGNNIDLNFLHNHILNYSNNKFKIFGKVSKGFETGGEKDKIYNDEKGEKFGEKRYDLITKNNIADLINNNQEVHLKINGVTVDVSDYSRRLNPSEGSFISVGHFIEGFPLKVPSLLDLGGMKIGAISSRIKNKDFEDIRYILKEGYTLEELLNSYIGNFGNNLIFYGYLEIIFKTSSINNEKYERIVWLNGNSGLSDEELLVYGKEICLQIMKIIIKNPRKYLREKDWELEREEIETEIESILGLKTKNNPNYYVVENFLNAFEKERLKIKEENSLKNQFKNLFKNIFKKAE